MSIDQELIKILRCPKCKGELELEEGETGFVCWACKLRYPVVNEIPNFLISDAEPVEK